MMDDLNQFHYMSQLLQKRTETYLFTLEEITYLLEVLHARIKELIEHVDPVNESLMLYLKIVNKIENGYAGSGTSLEIELTGSESFLLMLCVFMDPSDYKMKEKVYHNLHYGILQTVINDIEDEDI